MPFLDNLINTRPQSYTDEASWAQAALNALAQEVSQPLWAQVNGIADPIARLAALEPIMFRRDNQVYSRFKRNNPRPAPTPVAAPEPTPAATPAEPAAPAPIDPAKMDLAKRRALQSAELMLRSNGYDPAKYLPLISSEFDRIASTADPTLDKDPYALFTSDIADNVVKASQAQDRAAFTGQYENQFGEGADNAAIPTSLLDDAINSILGEQRTNAVQQLDRGKARGIYNDVGYNAGINAIDNAMAGGRSALGSLGSSIIDNYRSGLNEIGDRAYNAYNSFPSGSTGFSFDPYVSEYNDYVTRAKSNAVGDLRNVLGGTNYFDFGKIASGVGTAQGALNLRDADVATALGERKRLNSQSRGLGSQGAF